MLEVYCFNVPPAHKQAGGAWQLNHLPSAVGFMIASVLTRVMLVPWRRRLGAAAVLPSSLVTAAGDREVIRDFIILDFNWIAAGMSVYRL